MIRRAALVLLLFFCASAVFGQATATDSQTLLAMLAEVRELRKDLQTSAIAARRAQILIYRLHIQQAVVGQANGRLDQAKLQVEQLRRQRGYEESQITEHTEFRDQAQNEEQRTRWQNVINHLRAQLENLGPLEQEAQSTQIALEEQARIEQAKMNRLENELDELDRAVTSAALRQGFSQSSTAKLQ